MTVPTTSDNLGVPLFVDDAADLVAKPESSVDSWYVICNFEAGGRQFGFEWHQMVVRAAPGMKITTTEFLLMDATTGIWLDHASAVPVSDQFGATTDRCRVTSPFGTLEGDRQRLALHLATDDGALDVVIRPAAQTLYNGTVGLLPILGSQSFQYSFPNMAIDGTIRLKDETIQIADTTSWLDRQWAFSASPDALKPQGDGDSPSWTWLGMTLNPERTAAISLWDMVDGHGKRNVFATILDDQGVQSNHVADVTYDRVWTSDRTGNSYAGALEIAIPTADLELSLQALLERPEFDQGEDRRGVSGCQSPCTIRGHYGPTLIDRVVILEMIGDICGSPARR